MRTGLREVVSRRVLHQPQGFDEASVRHVAGSAILPSDFASRNAPAYEDQSCQVCSFVRCLEESVVRRVPIQVGHQAVQKAKQYQGC